MKFSPKKSVYVRALTCLTAFAASVALSSCASSDEAASDLDETSNVAVSDPVEYVPASEEGPAQNAPEPRLPALAAENSDEGARAALEYFWQAESYASLTGDSAPLALISSDDCAFCSESLEGWPRNYEEGYWSVMHGEIEVDITDVVRGSENETANVAHLYFQLTEPPTDFFDENGVRRDGSFDSSETQEWLAELVYDATAQTWQVEWLGLEEAVIWEEQ